MAPGASAVAAALGLGEEHRAWLAELEAVPPGASPRLPGTDELARLAGPLDLERVDRDALAATRPEGDEALMWLLERCHGLLVSELGTLRPLVRWPALPAALGARGRYFYAWVFLAAVPAIRSWHAARGVSDDVSWATLADLGEQLRIHRWMFATGGLHTQFWLTIHFRGILFRLGRLQFNRSRILPGTFMGPLFWYDDAALARLGAGFQPGDHTLGVHIPAGAPLDAAACDESLRAARSFFDTRFPDERARIAICTSWLLDDQLAEHLGAGSNIVRFQRRFEIVPGALDTDGDIVRFVFGRTPVPDLDTLPRRTTLERAIVAHLRSGGHWRTRTGWVEL